MSEEAVINVAVGDRYILHQNRLLQSVNEYWGGTVMFWTDQWPPHSPEHRQEHYAFKYFAARHAVEQGVRRFLYLDASMHCIAPLQPIFDRIARDGYYFVGGYNGEASGWQDLRWHISDDALGWVGVQRDQLVNAGVVGGGVVGLDLDHPVGDELWRLWKPMVELGINNVHWRDGNKPEGKVRSITNEGRLIADNPRVLSHLGDEATWSAILYKLGLKADAWEDYYIGAENGEKIPTGILKSGYDL